MMAAMMEIEVNSMIMIKPLYWNDELFLKKKNSEAEKSTSKKLFTLQDRERARICLLHLSILDRI